MCWGPGLEEALPEGSMQREGCLGPPGRVPLSWGLVEPAVTRQVAAGSVPQGWISLPPGESAHEVQRQLRGAGPDAQQSAGFGSLHIPQVLHPKPRAQDAAGRGRGGAVRVVPGEPGGEMGPEDGRSPCCINGGSCLDTSPSLLPEYLCGEHKQPLGAAISLGGEWDRGCLSSAALGAPGRAPAYPKCQHVALSLPEFRPLETTWALCSRIAECTGSTNWEMRSQPP